MPRALAAFPSDWPCLKNVMRFDSAVAARGGRNGGDWCLLLRAMRAVV